jgi:2-methylfumaryl-CoA hydratase
MATIRKQHGHYLEDFEPGALLRHKGGKTITEGLFALFTDFSFTPNPLSKNIRYAQAYGYRGLVVPSGLVMAVVFSQSVEDISENARANLEYIDMRFGAPVCVGDTLEAETLILSVKPSTKNANLGVVHVQTTGRNQLGDVVLTFQRKVQVWKKDLKARVDDREVTPRDVACAFTAPAHDATRAYKDLAHFSSPDTYLEDFEAGTVYEHVRGRVITTDHIMLTGVLDNTSQVHCNQWMIDQDPERFVGGKLIVFGGIPFQLCLGISSADVADNSLGDVRYATGRHTAPSFAGDTLFASTQIRGSRDVPDRPDLGILDTVLRGHKFVKKGEVSEKVEIFYLEREIALKRRRFYA